MNMRKRSARAKRAKVERFKPVKIAGYLNTRERASLPCGCAIYVGISSDTGKAAIAAQPCKEGHQMLTELANTLAQQRLLNPDRRKQMVELCVEVLTEAANQF